MAAVKGRPPALCGRALTRLVTELFPFKSVSESCVRSLPSYDDRNYYFRGVLEDHRAATAGRQTVSPSKEFVLKLGNPLCTTYETLRGINAMMRYLHDKCFTSISYPIQSRQGGDLLAFPTMDFMQYENGCCNSSDLDDAKIDPARLFLVRVVTFIPGEMFDEVAKHYLTPQLVYDVGKCIGLMDTVLKEFSNDDIADRGMLHWDLAHFPTLQNLLPSISDQQKRQMAETVFDLFEMHVSPKILSFKHGIIHGDPNGLNLVLKPNSSASDRYDIAGVIDFGDTVKTCYVYEAGIMLAYAMMENENPIEFVAPMLSGYLDAFPLSRREVDSLYYIVLARCCQSAMLGEHQYTLEPWNDYLLTSPAKAWKLIKLLLETPKEEVDRIWAQL